MEKNPQDTLNFEYLSMMLSTKNFFGHIKNYFSLNLSSGIFELRKKKTKDVIREKSRNCEDEVRLPESK